MSTLTGANKPLSVGIPDERILGKIGFLVGSAILLSGGIIWFYNQIIYNEQVFDIYTNLQLAGITLMPYMISAAIAAITAMCIMNFIPLAKSKLPAHLLAVRIKEFGEGDLSAFSRLNCRNEQLKEISTELCMAVNNWNSKMSQMKIINRQQWDLLQDIKRRAAKNDGQEILNYVQKMENNWIKIAEIEEFINS